MVNRILLRFDIKRNGETLTVDLDFKCVALTAVKIDLTYTRGDEDGHTAFALFTLVDGDSDDLTPIRRPFDFIDNFSSDAIFAATEAGGAVLHVCNGQLA